MSGPKVSIYEMSAKQRQNLRAQLNCLQRSIICCEEIKKAVDYLNGLSGQIQSLLSTFNIINQRTGDCAGEIAILNDLQNVLPKDCLSYMKQMSDEPILQTDKIILTDAELAKKKSILVKLQELQDTAVKRQEAVADTIKAMDRKAEQGISEAQYAIAKDIAGVTEGFCFTEINGLRRLCKNERISIRQMPSVIDLYKYGIRENPWDKLDENELASAYDDFKKRIKGQDYAIVKTLDVVKRAVTGMSGLQQSSHTKPKGILFFAGPTGTGKTETAKTLAEKLFGDESCCIRFDMSEYGQSHSDQKLLGAPPGYVGYEAGGQLTNAVKENPFSILLFDEIEKAHPSIFDKFLQILEDGRMTDGQGNTVYFSECIIIFTSNLGIFTRNDMGIREANVTEKMEYSEVQTKVRQAIENYFKLELGRPEILNRIGENIVVFDFIRPKVGETILDAQIKKIVDNLSSEKRIGLIVGAEARATLLEKSLDNLSNGARGIGNIVESLLINPLSRYLFDNAIKGDEQITINSIDARNMPFSLDCTRGSL